METTAQPSGGSESLSEVPRHRVAVEQHLVGHHREGLARAGEEAVQLREMVRRVVAALGAQVQVFVGDAAFMCRGNAPENPGAIGGESRHGPCGSTPRQLKAVSGGWLMVVSDGHGPETVWFSDNL